MEKEYSGGSSIGSYQSPVLGPEQGDDPVMAINEGDLEITEVSTPRVSIEDVGCDGSATSEDFHSNGTVEGDLIKEEGKYAIASELY